MGESKSGNRGRSAQDLLQKHAIFTSHTHSQGLTWQECQAKEEAPHLGAPLQLLGFIHSNLNGCNPTDKVWSPTLHTLTIRTSLDFDVVIGSANLLISQLDT